jgi:tetrahydromethanopterin S-methyltransferase subunit G
VELKDFEPIETVKKTAEAAWWLGSMAVLFLAFLWGKWVEHRKHAPRALIKELSDRVDELESKFEEQGKNVTATATNLAGLTDQLRAIGTDNVIKFADKPQTDKEFREVYERMRTLSDRIETLDNRVFDLTGVGGGRRHDPRDRR